MRKALVSAIYEYLLIVSPVFLYVFFEAITGDDPKFLLISPEWSIATTFLAFQGRVLYRRYLAQTGRQLAESWLELVDFMAFMVIVASSVNAYVSLPLNSQACIIFRVLLFGFVSCGFVAFASAGKVAVLRKREA